MSSQYPIDPRQEQAGASDDSLLSVHEKLLEKKPENGAHYRMLPLVLLFVFSGLIFYAGTYLNHFSGHYNSAIFNENAHPTNASAAAPKVDPMVLGKKAYDSLCYQCHQPDGKGTAGVYPPLAGSEWVTGSEERLIRIVVYGLKGPVTVAGHEYNAAAMPVIGRVTGSGYNWNDDKIAAVLTYIRASFGNQAGPVTTDQVAAIHTKEGDRHEWSQEELLKLK